MRAPFFSGRISDFIQRHPTLKVLALAFLLLIGCALVAEGFHKAIPKGYIYFAMAFSIAVESLNIRMRARVKPTPVIGNNSIRPEKTRIFRGFLTCSAAWMAG